MSRYFIEENSDSFPHLFVDKIPFHSTRNPFREGNFLAHWKGGSEPFPRFLFLVGVGLGYVLDFFRVHPELREQTQLFCLFEHETSRQFFENYREFFHWPREVKSLVFSKRAEWESLLFDLSPQDVGIWVHPTFQRLFPDESQEIQKQFHLSLKRALMNQITDVGFGFRWWRNALRNYVFGAISPLPKLQNSGTRPFLLLGSGLSTYEQISAIAKCKDQYWIMAALPVLELLEKWKITPDIVVMTDPAAANRFYRGVKKLPPQTLLVAYGYVYPLVLEWFPGQIFLMNGGLEQELALTPSWELIPSGGSVANTMLELAGQWAQESYYTGFDFQYSKAHPHYPGAPLETQTLMSSSRFATGETSFTMRVWGAESVVFQNERTSPVLKAYGEYFREQCHFLQGPNRSIQAWDFKKAAKYQKLPPKENFLREYGISYVQNLSQEEKLEQIQKFTQSVQESLKKGDFERKPEWKSLLAKSRLKKLDSRAILEKERIFLNQLIDVLKFSNHNENSKDKG